MKNLIIVLGVFLTLGVFISHIDTDTKPEKFPVSVSNLIQADEMQSIATAIVNTYDEAGLMQVNFTLGEQTIYLDLDFTESSPDFRGATDNILRYTLTNLNDGSPSKQIGTTRWNYQIHVSLFKQNGDFKRDYIVMKNKRSTSLSWPNYSYLEKGVITAGRISAAAGFHSTDIIKALKNYHTGKLQVST